jgi:hypothetical protein
MDCSFGHGEFAVDVSRILKQFPPISIKKRFPLLSTNDSNFLSKLKASGHTYLTFERASSSNLRTQQLRVQYHNHGTKVKCEVKNDVLRPWP